MWVQLCPHNLSRTEIWSLPNIRDNKFEIWCNNV